MSISKKPSEEILAYIDRNFDYDAEEGTLWRMCGRQEADWRECTNYNAKGYLQVGIGNRRNFIVLRGHNICWYLKKGEWPEKEVDHRDTNKANNKWSNLRLADRSIQQLNRNRSGKYLPGVCFYRYGSNHFMARIQHNGISETIGCFPTEIMAHEAYREAYKRIYGVPLDFPYKEWHKPVVAELPLEEIAGVYAESIANHT